jgi:hypothetical protein
MKKKVPCEVWSRIVGYFRPYSEANPGKKEEFKNRYLQNPENIVSKLNESNCKL